MVVKACVRVEALWCERLWIAKCCLETRSFTMCIESIRCPYAKCLVSRAVASWQRKSLWTCSILLFSLTGDMEGGKKIVQMKTTGVQQVKWQSDRLSGRLAARRTQVVLRQRCKRFQSARQVLEGQMTYFGRCSTYPRRWPSSLASQHGASLVF